MNIKTGDIIMVKDSTLLARLIGYFTKSEYVHCAIVYDVMCSEIYVGEIDWSYSFKIREINYDNYDLYRYVGELDTEKCMNAICNMKGFKYDYLDIFRILFKLPLKYTPKTVICSESIYYIYMMMGIKLTDKLVPLPYDLIERELLIRII